MKNVKLLCAAGTSTQVLATKVQEMADKLGIELTIAAASIADVAETCADADLLLLTPQVEFKIDAVKMACPDKKIAVLDPAAFAEVDVEAVIAQINQELGA